MATDYLTKYRENAPRMAINWDPNNPKLKCKKDIFRGIVWFEKGKEYQIYRVTFIKDENDKVLWFFYMFHDEHLSTFLSEERDGLESIYNCFENVEQVIRKAKLERLNEIDESGLY